MYRLKQWREARVTASLAVLGLVWLLYVVLNSSVHVAHGTHVDSDFSGFTVFMFSTETVLIGWWGWMVGSFGTGKSLGEGRGAFLLTRPHSRAWFVWRDWSFGFGLVLTVAVLANLILGIFSAHMMSVTGLSVAHVPVAYGAGPSLARLMSLQTLVVLAFAGLMYGLSYASTVMLRRNSGIMLSAGLVIAYTVARATLRHQYGFDLPSILPAAANDSVNGSEILLVSGLATSLTVRLALVAAFPFLAQWLLTRAQV